MNVRFRSTYVSLFLLLLTCSVASTAQGVQPLVRFDMPYMLEARDVTPDEFAATHPGERLREVRFPISTFVSQGNEGDLTQVLYQMEGPQAMFEVVDFLPKTTLNSRYAAPILVEHDQESGGEFKIDFGGNYQVLTTAVGSLQIKDKTRSSVKAELLPPVEALAASGTLQRQRGVYFRLRSMPQTWLEGEREFAIILRVPAHWRGDYILVRCQADAHKKGLVSAFDETVTAGRRDFVVAIYASGDVAARSTAAAFVRAETRMRRVVIDQQQAIERAGQSSFARWGLELPGEKPRIPGDWMSRLVVGGYSTEQIPSRLPPIVREAASEFVEARNGMAELARGQNEKIIAAR